MFSVVLDSSVSCVVDNTKLDGVVSHETVEVAALAMVDLFSVNPGDYWQPPWTPPELLILCSICIERMQLTNACFEVSFCSGRPITGIHKNVWSHVQF
jgi:hypothetical protein